MATKPGRALAAAAGAGAAAILHRARRQAGAGAEGVDDTATTDSDDRSRWRAVTIDRSPEDVVGSDGALPAPLAELGDLVDVRVQAAPGDKGTELAARLRIPEPSGPRAVVSRFVGTDPRQRVRAALRESKQLIEVGEVLRVDPVPHGMRSHTPAGQAIEFATRRAGGEGVQ